MADRERTGPGSEFFRLTMRAAQQNQALAHAACLIQTNARDESRRAARVHDRACRVRRYLIERLARL